ncbi:sensor histidine kinase [Streptomonospora wellingtoniae]|uniref:histidine kinase n=1 Tax=Streptomonospora wellingtoniae TaxID=3075544 RepID=A0ABU2KNJ2_9ACTN|nr:histidine kinase [Streptomonospora sp. DSM 45055]MDT0300791.1 histidine kinase [Streptomonospora sp. DSM 45055]
MIRRARAVLRALRPRRPRGRTAAGPPAGAASTAGPDAAVSRGAILSIGPLRIPEAVVDLLLAAGVAVLQLAVASGQDGVEPGLAVLLAGAAAMALLTRFPHTAAVGMGLSVLGYYMTAAADIWVAWVGLVVAVVRLGALGERSAALAAVGAVLAVSGVVEVLDFQISRALSVLSWALVVLLVGEIARSQRAYVREAQQRAAEAERTREEEARRRAVEERLRIAREVHDVVAHSISLINVQAGAAAHRRDDPDGAYAALNHIKEASRDTLRELRSTLGVLRRIDDDGAPTAPVPSLARVGDLAEQTTAAGLPVRLEVTGTAAQLPAAVDLAAYRIVQESLTNALRHSGAGGADVCVDYGGIELRVLVADDGGGAVPGSEPQGNGLRGMRERAAAVGGTCSAGPRGDGPGFAVRAALPLPAPGGSAAAPPGGGAARPLGPDTG